MSSSPPIPTMLPFPAGLAPTEGIPTVAQAVLHEEILHVHATLPWNWYLGFFASV